MKSRAQEVEALLSELADSRYVAQYEYFFKTEEGQYGAGDKFLGIKNPTVRSVVKDIWQELSIEDAAELAKSRWHEARLCALLVLVEKMLRAVKRRDEEQMQSIWHCYTSLHPHINNWDLVDLSAIKIAGNWECLHPEETLLDEWVRLDDSHLWQRRIAMVATWVPIRRRDFTKVLERAELLVDSKQDLLHKAAGWMLREMYKHEGQMALEEFLEANAARMSAVMLSYACEKMSLEQRQYWRERRPRFYAGKH